MTKPNSAELTKSLMANAALVTQIAEPVKPMNSQQMADIEEDYAISRSKIKGLIDRSEEAIDRMMDLASQTEHPRAFEVLSQMIKNTSDMAMELSELQKRRKALHKVDPQTPEQAQSGTKGNVTNNTIFMGSTTDLQKFLANQAKKEPVIDLDHDAQDSE